MDFIITKEIKDMIERWNFQLNLRCVMYGHDYHNVDNDKICICCGHHLGKGIEPIWKIDHA